MGIDWLTTDWVIDWHTKWLTDWLTDGQSWRLTGNHLVIQSHPAGESMAFLIVWCIIQIHIQNNNREYCCQACAMQIGMVAQNEIRVLSVHTSISQLWQNKWKVATVNYLPGSTQMNFHSIIKWIFYYYHLKVTDILYTHLFVLWLHT